MQDLAQLDRKVETSEGHGLTFMLRGKSVAVEIGTDTGFIQISFDNPNDLRAIAGHASAIADEQQRNQQGGGYARND